jgi:hypothetical protein
MLKSLNSFRAKFLVFRQDVCVRHDVLPSLRHAAKIRGGPPAVPSPEQSAASTITAKVTQRPSGKTSKMPNTGWRRSMP